MKKIGIIAADSEEFRPLEKLAEENGCERQSFLGRKKLKFKLNCSGNETEMYALNCGIGKVNAAAAAVHLVDTGCDVILNYGLSGGIGGVSCGDICVCDKYLEHDFDLTDIGYKPCEKPAQKYIFEADEELLKLIVNLMPGIKRGTAVTGDRFVCNSEYREFLKKEFGAMCCDMETAAIAYVCEFAAVPFAAVRQISDDAGEDAAESYRRSNNSGEISLFEFLLEIINAEAGR